MPITFNELLQKSLVQLKYKVSCLISTNAFTKSN